MADQKDSTPKNESTPSKKENSMITLALRFMIFFGISFFLLSLPYGQRPVFYVLHQGVSKVIAKATGTNYYKPTFNIVKEVKDTMDETQSRLAAPVEKAQNNSKKIFNEGVLFKNKAERIQKALDE